MDGCTCSNCRVRELNELVRVLEREVAELSAALGNAVRERDELRRLFAAEAEASHG